MLSSASASGPSGEGGAVDSSKESGSFVILWLCQGERKHCLGMPGEEGDEWGASWEHLTHSHSVRS